ncbi:hypothetical protein SAMN06265370_11138 [Puniceibacterium sediminis]|uniref:Uncharacterized protein n=1 Tax=Puniceibacterium sediminis TaxID=1608407 RepID=A0A238XGC6_9RHOB|nr:hypothetical protein SAMN06265370_11138 [Puniceibacterium sediminis]
MAVRIFTCKSCNYEMRLGASDCRYCFKPAPFLNRRKSLIGLAVITVLAFVWVVLGPAG